MWLTLLALSVRHAEDQIKRYYFTQNSAFHLSSITFSFSFWSAPRPCWVASLLPILDEKSYWCIWFHKQPRRGWIMKPESWREFSWLLPSRKQEKGRSQKNSPSFIPSCISSGEVLFAKQKGLLCFFMTCEAGPACKCVTLWLAHFFTLHFFSLTPNTPGLYCNSCLWLSLLENPIRRVPSTKLSFMDFVLSCFPWPFFKLYPGYLS